jgi:hypothetical protein
MDTVAKLCFVGCAIILILFFRDYWFPWVRIKWFMWKLSIKSKRWEKEAQDPELKEIFKEISKLSREIVKEEKIFPDKEK